jgi:hypothetical protein
VTDKAEADGRSLATEEKDIITKLLASAQEKQDRLTSLSKTAAWVALAESEKDSTKASVLKRGADILQGIAVGTAAEVVKQVLGLR